MSENMDNKPTGQPTPTPSGQPMGQPQQPQTATPPAAQPQPAVQQPVTQPQPAVQQPAAQAPAAPVQATAQPTATSAKSTAEPSEKPAPPKTQPTGGDNKTNNPDNKKKKKKRKSDWGGRLITAILSIILGFVLGVGSVFGTVTAIIYSIGTQPVDETVELVDTIVPGLNLSELLFDNESGILSEEYAHKKIMDLVGDVADAISGLASEETTIKNITDLSPYVGVQLRKLLDTVKTDFGIPLDYDTLLNTKITGGVDEEGSLVKQLLEDVMNTELCALLDTFLGEEEMNPILKYLCYGKEGVDYTLDENGKPQPIEEGAKFLTIKDLASEGGEEVLYGLEIAALLSINEYDPTDPIHSILFKDGVDENGNDVKIPLVINDLIHDSESVVNGIKITGILGITEYDPEDPIHSILFKDGVDENGNDVKVPVSVGDFMTDSESIINGIKIANILGETEYDSTDPIHAILFKDGENGEKVPVTVGDFVNDSQTIINNVKIAEILGETTYDPTNSMHAILFKDGENGEKVPVTVQDLTGEFIDNIKVAEILGETTYDATNPMHAILFKDSTDADGNPAKVPVALKDLTGDFINNIKIAEILGETTYDATNPMHAILFKDGTDADGNPVKVPVTINELDETFINDIKVADILGIKPDDDNSLTSILYDENGKALTINELSEFDLNTIKLADVLTLKEDASEVLLSIVFKGEYKLEGEGENAKYVPIDDKEENASRTLGELTGDMTKIINGIELDNVITVDENTHPALLSIIYVNGDKNQPRTIEMLSTDSDSIINGIKLSDVIDESTANPVIKSLLTTTDDEGNEIPTTLAHLTDSAQSEKLINSIKLSDVIDESTASPVIKSLLTTTDDEGNEIPTTLAHLTDSAQSEKLINGIKLADVIETDDALLKSILYVDSDESNPRTLGDFKGDGAQNIINAIKLADVLGITEDSHAALIFLAYGGKEITDSPRTLGEIRTMGDDLINDIPLSYVISPDMDNSIVSYLIYGIEDVHYTVETTVENGSTVKTAKMLQRHIIIDGGLAYNEYGEALNAASYTLNGTSTFTELNGDGEEDDVTYNLTLGTRADETEVYYLFDGTTAVEFTETTLKQFSGSSNLLTKLTSRLTVGDILGEEIDGNPMLKHLAGTPIDQLSTAVGELSFGQVFEDQIYRTYKEGDSYVDSNGETVNVGDYIDYDGNKILYDPDSGVDNRVLGDIWHYMLTGEDEYGNKYNAAYEYSVVNDMDKLIENMKREVHDAQLKQLAHDGILNLSNDILNREIILEIADYPVNTTHPSGTLIGDLTTEQMLIYVEELLKAVDYVNSLA